LQIRIKTRTLSEKKYSGVTKSEEKRRILTNPNREEET